MNTLDTIDTLVQLAIKLADADKNYKIRDMLIAVSKAIRLQPLTAHQDNLGGDK